MKMSLLRLGAILAWGLVATGTAVAAEAGTAPLQLEEEQRDAPPQKSADLLLSEFEPLAWMAALVYCNREPPALVDAPEDCGRRLNESQPAMQAWRALVHHTPFLQEYDETLSNLVFTIYGRKSDHPGVADLVIAFRGTTNSGADWRSNFRWGLRFLPGADHYRIVSRRADEILAEALKRASESFGAPDQPVKRYRLITTGHSLGGGLAQLMAYRISRENVSVAAVAFDTTVVTGYETLVTDEQVNCRVPVWRVEERGEILAPLRAAFRNIYGWSENIRRVRYNFVHGRNPVAQHSIHTLAKRLTAEVDAQPGSTRNAALRFDNLFAPAADCSCEFRRKGQAMFKVRELPRCARF